ncbi:DNA polymerase III, partial [Methylobacterium sp. WL103]
AGAGAISGRILRALKPAEPDALRFAMRGSTGNRYEVSLEDRTSGLMLRCTCMAGRHGVRCRHVKALVVGDITDLLSNNHADVEVLRRRLAAVG